MICTSKHSGVALLLVLTVLLVSAVAAAPAFSTDLSTQRIIDHHGRERYFHGTNLVRKSWPYHPTTAGPWNNRWSFVAKDMALLEDLGLNAIRLGTMWNGAEPHRGVYNMSYYAVLRQIIKEAKSYGIHSLLDMHQDLYSPVFCGDGMPTWLPNPANASTFPWPLQPTPFNRSSNGSPVGCGKYSWSEYYATLGIGEAFQNLYDNVGGVRDAWAMFWQTTAREMRALGDAVLGYELINEPWAGDIFRDPLLLIPGVADKQNLQLFYDVAHSAIRKVDTEHQVYFEPVTWDDFGVGFEHVPGGDQWRNKSVLSYHFYVPPDFSVDVQFGARMKDMKRLGSAGMLTEFFAQDGEHGEKVVPAEEVLAACDDNKQSWLYWQYWGTLFHDNGTVVESLAHRVARTYPQIVAGVTKAFKFDPATASFTLQFTVSAGVTNRTSEIYYSGDRHYTRGVRVAVTVDNSTAKSSEVWFSKAGKNRIAVQHSAALRIGTVVGVSINHVSP